MLKTRYISIRSGDASGKGQNTQGRYTVRTGGLPFLSPGIFLLLLGLVTVLAPQFVLSVIAAFLLFFGGLLLFLGYKFFTFKKHLVNEVEKMQRFTEQFSAKNQQGPHITGHTGTGQAGSTYTSASARDSYFSRASAYGKASYEDEPQVTSYEINGETVEVVDADEEDDGYSHRSDSPFKSRGGKVIIH
ncbi:MAG: hypothetical protein KDD70_06070 [Bdellovibrionales bacterium]|nr:hypothetical protein [Bdellovibrionales bacterium]